VDCNVDERNVPVRDLCKYRAVGEYLKNLELPEMLTWEAIHEAMPKLSKLSKRGRTRSRWIRSGLLELANHFLPQQLVRYQRERVMEKWLRSTPVMFVEHVIAFEKWASEGMLNPKLDINLHEAQPLTNTSDYTLKTVKTVIRFLSGASSATSAHSPTSTRARQQVTKKLFSGNWSAARAENESH